LSEYNGVTVITDNAWASNETLELFTDSAGGQNRGFGALIIILYCKVDKTRYLTRDITLTDFEDFLLIM
jgi:hypothetical protein